MYIYIYISIYIYTRTHTYIHTHTPAAEPAVQLPWAAELLPVAFDPSSAPYAAGSIAVVVAVAAELSEAYSREEFDH